MEPFGLLNFLQSLLPTSTTENASSAPPAEEEFVNPPTPTQNENNPPPAVRNAALDFLDEHERRARNFRK